LDEAAGGISAVVGEPVRELIVEAMKTVVEATIVGTVEKVAEEAVYTIARAVGGLIGGSYRSNSKGCYTPGVGRFGDAVILVEIMPPFGGTVNKWTVADWVPHSQFIKVLINKGDPMQQQFNTQRLGIRACSVSCTSSRAHTHWTILYHISLKSPSDISTTHAQNTKK
jgi:hypothetical protein